MASSADRGKSSKCCTNTRITGSGSSSAASSSFIFRVPATLATAAFTADGFRMFVSIAEGATAPAGSGSTANPSTAPVRVNRAAETRSGAISIANPGCGVASSHRISRRTASILYMPVWYALTLLNESHLINLAQRRQPILHFHQPALTQGNHTLVNCCTLDFRGRPTPHNHFPDVV